MDVYGRGQQGASEPDPSQEWSNRVPESSAEEAVWQLPLGAEGESTFPDRPNEPNCIYYLRTGFCGYGSRCRFHHPRDRAVLGSIRGSVGEFPERVGQPVCQVLPFTIPNMRVNPMSQYYMRTGTCKFGASCKYHHPKHGGSSSSSALQLNYYGYPLRPGEKECAYFLKTGQCKFGATCKFHHPMPVQPPTAPLPAAAVFPPTGIVLTRPPVLQSYVPGPYGPVLLSPNMYPSWTAYPIRGSSIPSQRPVYGVAQLSPSSAAYLPVKESQFPERPGQPECQYYMKTGDCKYGFTCRFHHPPEVATPSTETALNPVGLPLRPGAQVCSYFTQHGQCKFGAACLYDHPMPPLHYSPSAPAPSLSEMPVGTSAPEPASGTSGAVSRSLFLSSMSVGSSSTVHGGSAHT